MSNRNERFRYAVMSLTLGGVLVLSRFIDPDSLPQICLFRMLSGKLCMFCGLTHAFHAISLGDFKAAVIYHPLAWLAYGLVVFHFVLSCMRLAGWKYPAFFPRIETAKMMWATFAVFTVFWAARNLHNLL